MRVALDRSSIEIEFDLFHRHSSDSRLTSAFVSECEASRRVHYRFPVSPSFGFLHEDRVSRVCLTRLLGLCKESRSAIFSSSFFFFSLFSFFSHPEPFSSRGRLDGRKASPSLSSPDSFRLSVHNEVLLAFRIVCVSMHRRERAPVEGGEIQRGKRASVSKSIQKPVDRVSGTSIKGATNKRISVPSSNQRTRWSRAKSA